MGADATPGPKVSPAATGGAGTKPPLDDMMLAMDVVDTLRRRERLAKSELDEAGREADLKERLRKIYADQGLEVSDKVIEQAVAALREERFAYKPPPSSLATRLALLYIRRGVWGKWLAGMAGAGVLGTALFYFLVVAPKAALPRELTDLHREVAAMAQTPDARAAVNRVYHAGQAALREDNSDAAREALAKLGDLRSVLGQEYTLRIVNRPGVMTGVYRIPDLNTGARNYYIVVEAVDPSGRVLTVPIQNEETKATERVKLWGLRVDQRTFNAVAADKKDDGIVQRDRFGYKEAGRVTPDYDLPTTGGAITKW
jgi:hypothetical protein